MPDERRRSKPEAAGAGVTRGTFAAADVVLLLGMVAGLAADVPVAFLAGALLRAILVLVGSIRLARHERGAARIFAIVTIAAIVAVVVGGGLGVAAAAGFLAYATTSTSVTFKPYGVALAVRGVAGAIVFLSSSHEAGAKRRFGAGAIAMTIAAAVFAYPSWRALDAYQYESAVTSLGFRSGERDAVAARRRARSRERGRLRHLRVARQARSPARDWMRSLRGLSCRRQALR